MINFWSSDFEITTPTAGTTEIGTAFSSFFVKANSSSLPFRSAFADNKSSKALSTSVCSASLSSNIVFAATNFLSYSSFLCWAVLPFSSVEFL